jgi:alpha-glucosidase
MADSGTRNEYKPWQQSLYRWLAMLFLPALSGILAWQVICRQWGISFRVQTPPLAPWVMAGAIWQTPTIMNPKAIIAQDVCPGYSLSKVKKHSRGLTGSLSLANPACNVYGRDHVNLTLAVYYDTETRLHVTIEDDEKVQYRVPPALVGVPSPSTTIGEVEYTFEFNESPFEFWISRSDGETLFDTRGWKLVFETQYLELTTNLEKSVNIYGLGEAIHSLRLRNDFTRTMWAKYFLLLSTS